jgi:hypothetical protein
MNFSGLANDATVGRAEQYALAPGGHATDITNGSWKIDYRQDAPIWVQVHAGSSGSELAAEYTWVGDTGIQNTPHTHIPSSLVPCGAHNYAVTQIVRKFNVGVRTNCLAAGYPHNGFSALDCDGFDLLTNTWIPGTGGAQGQATYPDLINLSAQSGSPGGTITCKHPITEDIWYNRGANWNKAVMTSRTSLTWTSPTTIDAKSWHHTTPCIDPVRNRIVCASSFNGTPILLVHNLSDHSENGGGLNGNHWAGDIPDNGVTMYDSRNDRYMFLAMGFPADINNGLPNHGRLYEIHPDTYATQLVKTIPELTSGGGRGASGPWNRAEYFPELRGIIVAFTESQFGTNNWGGRSLFILLG